MISRRRRVVTLVVVFVMLTCFLLNLKPVPNPAEDQTHAFKGDGFNYALRIPPSYNSFVIVNNPRRPLFASDLQCLTIKIPPQIPVCVYKERDLLSASIIQNGVYEHALTGVIQDILDQDQDLGFIDIGASIGYYSLIAAAMGHPVVAVEPLPENVRRFSRAAYIAGTETRILLLQNAVSDHHEIRPIDQNNDDIGNSTLVNAHATCRKKKSGCPVIKTIFMDDLVPFVTFPRAILKLHISGSESHALRKASLLFHRVDIPYVFVKAKTLRDQKGAELTHFFESLYYTPFGALSGEALDSEKYVSWKGDVMWVKAKQNDPDII